MFDRKKFKALVYYVCWQCPDPTRLGSVKLNKVLWFADTEAFVERGSSITGARYVKQQFGPVPTAILPVLRELEAEGKIAVREVEFFGLPKREFFARTAPVISTFSPEEISLVDNVIRLICDEHTARSISDATHDRIWALAEIGEEIPYQAVLAATLDEINEDDLRWAKETMKSAKGAKVLNHRGR
jgi:hypothetical protein